MNNELNNQGNMENNIEQPVSTEPTSAPIEPAAAPKKGGKAGLILVILIVLCLLGGGGYYVFTNGINANKKQDANTTTTTTDGPTDTTGTTTSSSTSTTAAITGTRTVERKSLLGVYKTKNGESLDVDTGYKDETKYGAKYKGKKYILYLVGSIDDQYWNLVGDPDDDDSPCGTVSFMINSSTKELLDLKYDSKFYNKYKVGSYTYFGESSSCLTEPNKIYNEKIEYVADEFVIDAITSDYFYAIKDGYVVKISNDGKELKKGIVKLDKEYNYSILAVGKIKGDNLYSLIQSSKKTYLYDFNNDKKYEFELTDDLSMSSQPFNKSDGYDYFKMTIKDNTIEISVVGGGENDERAASYTFDLTTNKFTK